MATISDLASASAILRNAAGLSDAEYERQICDHVKFCRQLLSNKVLETISRDDSLFDDFDPESDSIAYLFLLRSQIQTFQRAARDAPPPELLPSGTVWSRAARYLRLFDRVQVRYAGLEWRQLVEFVGKAAQAASQPLLAIDPVREAILRLDPSCTVFTSTHLLLVRLCLHARSYVSALPVLDKHVCHIPTVTGRGSSKAPSLPFSRHESNISFITEASGLSSRLSYKEYLCYFLYAAMVYMALKQWRKASHFLGIVISMPTLGSISMIMVEAYKKWVLVGLIQDGKLRQSPLMAAPHVVKLYQSLAKPYINLAHTFERGDTDRMMAEVDAARDIWAMDRNTGLVCQVVNAFSRHTVIKLRTTFAALTVAELLGQSSPLSTDRSAAESFIASLITAGALKATLVQSPDQLGDTMLRFSATPSYPQLPGEVDMQVQFRRERQLLESLMRSLEEGNRTMGLSDEYTNSLQKSQKWAGVSQLDQGVGEEVGLEMDEDIMGGLS